MMLIDTHAHINLNAFRDDATEAIQRAHEAGVTVVNVGTQIDTSRQAVKLLEQFPEKVYAVVGLHPLHTWKHRHDDFDEQELAFNTREELFDYEAYKQLADNPRVVGIGECGLDYYRLPDVDTAPIKAKQGAVFIQQIELAQELDKALCIHCRPSNGTNDAYEDVLEIMGQVKQNNPRFRFEVHCYTGDLPTALKFVELGGFIGLNGIITFDKTGRSEEVVKGLPLEAIVLETDAPYLAPVPYRGKRNEPAYVVEVAKKIAEWKGISFGEVTEVTTKNTRQLFNIKHE
jgi:TatD DNase family protein